jgi:hypothetical protein
MDNSNKEQMMRAWDQWSLNQKISFLAGNFEISSFLLQDDDTLMKLLKTGAEFDQIYDYISDNY